MKIQSLLTLAATSAFITSASASISMDWVNVGDPGNLAQSDANRTHAFGTNGDGYGAVADTYRIGRDLVTNNQYATFLNATAASDPHGLYNANMSSSTHGGITRNGSSGGFGYLVKTDMGKKPVNFVSWYDSARFTNWLNNGQGSGSTETGAYTLTGNTGIITKNSGATVWIPAEDEWFKAAYYDGETGQYSLYATGANIISTEQANYAGSVGTVTDVGAYDFPSYYGTYDQAGNVWEWNDAVSGSSRGLRGGSWATFGEIDLLSSGRILLGPTDVFVDVGFRVASVPEPSALVLTMLFSAALVTRRKR